MILVVFDCDGTLVDSQHAIGAAMTAAFLKGGRAVPPREAIRRVVGLSLETAVHRLVPDAGDAEVRALAESYKSEFQKLRQRPDHDEPLFPGIRETLARLAGERDIVLGIATGKSMRGVAALLAREDLEGVFATVQTADTHPSKPHPAMLETAMREVGAERHRTVMIGDTTFDMEMAIRAGAQALGVAWGYHEIDELEAAGAHAISHASERLMHDIAAAISLMESVS